MHLHEELITDHCPIVIVVEVVIHVFDARLHPLIMFLGVVSLSCQLLTRILHLPVHLVLVPVPLGIEESFFNLVLGSIGLSAVFIGDWEVLELHFRLFVVEELFQLTSHVWIVFVCITREER